MNPAAIWCASIAPVTGSGNACAVVVPSPSSPMSLLPQHCTVLSSSRAQLWRPPAATAADSGKEKTPTGAPLLISEPLPSWP